MTVAVCPGCGYPTLGPALCYYCRPMTVDVRAVATTPIPAQRGLSAPGPSPVRKTS